MSYAVIYSSRTGNTKLLADALIKVLPQRETVYVGGPSESALSADRLYVGFWTDKGSCDAETAAFLENVHGKEVFLFGTAGFGGEAAYFDQILERVCQHLNDSNTIIGMYMCQGKMPVAVRARYEKMMAAPNPAPNLQTMIENFDRAMSHPDEADLESLKKAVLAV